MLASQVQVGNEEQKRNAKLLVKKQQSHLEDRGPVGRSRESCSYLVLLLKISSFLAFEIYVGTLPLAAPGSRRTRTSARPDESGRSTIPDVHSSSPYFAPFRFVAKL